MPVTRKEVSLTSPADWEAGLVDTAMLSPVHVTRKEVSLTDPAEWKAMSCVFDLQGYRMWINSQ